LRVVTRFLGGLFIALGWVAFSLLAVLLVAEKTGILTRLAHRTLAGRMHVAGGDLRIEHVSLSWFLPQVTLRGVELGEEGGTVRLEESKVAFDLLRKGGPRLRRVDVRGGRVRLSHGLSERLRALVDALPPRDPGARHTAEIPSITLRGVEVELETQRFHRLPLGIVDVAVRAVPDGGPVLTGRLVPSLSSAPGGSGEIVLAGQESEPGSFDVSASAAGIPISADFLPQGTELDALRSYAPQGVLAVRAEGVISLEGPTPPRGRVRMTWSDGRLATASGHALEDLHLELEAEYAPRSGEEPWSLAAWEAMTRISGRWRDVTFESSARLADPLDPALSISGELHLPRLPWTRELLDLFGGPPAYENLWAALEPRGESELWIGFGCARGWTPGEPVGEKLGVAVEIGLSGGAGMTYRGFPSQASSSRDQGFPLPIDGIRGSALVAFDAARRRPVLLGIADVAGNPAQGSVRARGIVTSHPTDAPADAPGRGYVELDLDIRGEKIPIDGTLRSALHGLAGSVPPATTWEPYNLVGGELAAAVRVVRTVEMPYAAVDLALDLGDVALAWKDLPVPVSRASGTFRFVTDGRSERGLAARMQGSLRTASGLGLSLRFQTDPSRTAPAAGKSRIDEIAFLRASAQRVSLTGDDQKILVRELEFIGSAMETATPRGFADASYTQVRAGPDPRRVIFAEVTPREAELTPRDFKIPASSVRGRVLVNGVAEQLDSDTRAETIVSPLVGTLSGGMQVAFTAAFPGNRMRIQAAGLDPGNPGLLGALMQATRSSSGGEGPDLAGLRVEGALDVEGTITLVGTSTPAAQLFRLFLRENRLQIATGFRLDDLHGVLELRGDKVLLGHEVRASLAGTVLDLAELRYASTPEGFELTTRILPVENLPLDRDHLRPFVDDTALDALLGPLGWRGRIDVQSGRLRITGPRTGDTRLEFVGDITASDMQVQLGLPFSVTSATASIQKLIYESGRVRAVCRIRDLFGKLADRELDRANLLITYVEPRLSIESIDGELEGGAIRPLGEGAERGGTAFSIDLVEPFPFQLALDLRGVELSGLSRGLFATSLATQGKLDCRLRLTGDTRRVLGIQGSGSVHVSEARLWSLPVFRALFSQLDLDDKAVFNELACNLRIKNGVLWTDDISVQSDILQLVGKGSIDFDGTLKEELQIRYGLIDRLGPLTRLVYAIQKELLSVAIRGDLGRPKVILRNPWTRVASQNERYRSLPLPPLSSLPPRF